MASVFKKTTKNGVCWYFDYTNHLGLRSRKKGFPDKRETERMAAKYELDAKRRRDGLIDPAEENYAEYRRVPLEKHLTDYKASLKAKRRSAKYIRLVLSRVRRVFDNCGYRYISEFDAPDVEQQLAQIIKEGEHGPKTFNHYVQAIWAFCNWMTEAKRMKENPFTGLSLLNVKVDIRHDRRALEPAQVSQLMDAALTSNCKVQSYDGLLRARTYSLAYYTGLRQKELAALTPKKFRLQGPVPVVVLEAEFTKNGEDAVIPLHPDLVGMLNGWLPELDADAALLPRFAKKKAWLMVKKDLERVGIPYYTDDGFADFHSLRAAYITHMLDNGTSITETQKLARHSDIRLTAGYAKASRKDQADAVRNLPSTTNSSQWNNQFPARPEKSNVSSVDRQNPPGNGHSNPSCESTSGSEKDKESGTGDDCPQSRKKWRRRESNPRPAIFQRRLLRA
jgi:integrase